MVVHGRPLKVVTAMVLGCDGRDETRKCLIDEHDGVDFRFISFGSGIDFLIMVE